MFKSIQYQLKLVENTDYRCNDNHGFKIGFFVTNSKPLQNIKDGTDVIYDEVITNTGQGYDVTTGKFKAPVQGLYFFTLTSLTHSQKIFATELKKNGKIVARNHATARGISDQMSATQSVVLHLNTNDIVNIKVLKTIPAHFSLMNVGQRSVVLEFS
ncbi:C1QL [Mytilus edulis]|uniref:C1QL n=1 Tax=Mytilus edulis TaxID=6550 RepID=A0A8S3V288_MYTED|nr:C1QL [Mytilus edulis]